jgi:hypothetical protein
MGHNRAGVRRKARLRRSKRETERLADKASPDAKQSTGPKGESGKSGK